MSAPIPKRQAYGTQRARQRLTVRLCACQPCRVVHSVGWLFILFLRALLFFNLFYYNLDLTLDILSSISEILLFILLMESRSFSIHDINLAI